MRNRSNLQRGVADERGNLEWIRTFECSCFYYFVIICINIFLYFVIFLDTDDHTDEARHGSALTAEDLKMVSSLKKMLKKKRRRQIHCHVTMQPL